MSHAASLNSYNDSSYTTSARQSASTTTTNKPTGPKSSDSTVATTTSTPPTSSSGNFFVSLPTHFSKSTITNYGAQVFDIHQLPSGIQSALRSIPPDWLQRASPEQIQGLLTELQDFHSRAIASNTVNPGTFSPHPNIVDTQPVLFDNADYEMGFDGTADLPDTPLNPYLRRDTYAEQADTHWYNSIDISTAVGSARDLFQQFKKLEHGYGELAGGFDIISNYSSLLGDTEAVGALGDAALAAGESLAGELGMEGLALAGAEFLGGAASIGAFIAGGEIIAGAALAGYGLYEGAKALGLDKGFEALGGSSLGQEAQSVLNAVKGPLESFIGWGEGLFP